MAVDPGDPNKLAIDWGGETQARAMTQAGIDSTSATRRR